MTTGARREVLVGPERPVAPGAVGIEEAEEAGLRPRTLGEFVGQGQLVEHLRIVLEAAVQRGQPVDHILFAGPPAWARPRSPASSRRSSAWGCG